MLTNEKIESFAKYFSKSQATQKGIISILKAVMRYEEQFGHGVEQFSIDELSQMFTECRWLDKNASFGTNRAYIRAYVQSIDESEETNIDDFSVDNIDTNINYKKKYFSSVQEFLDFLNGIFVEEYQIRMMAICVMYWIGFTPAEVADLKISDIDFEENSVLGRKNVDLRLLDVLKRCYEATQFDVANGTGTKTLFIANGEYIIRKAEGGDHKNNGSNVTVKAINALTDRAKDTIKKSGKEKQINQKCLAASGRYVTVYEYQITHPDSNLSQEEMENLLGKKFSSKSVYHVFMRKYKEWRKYFYNI